MTKDATIKIAVNISDLQAYFKEGRLPEPVHATIAQGGRKTWQEEFRNGIVQLPDTGNSRLYKKKTQDQLYDAVQYAAYNNSSLQLTLCHSEDEGLLQRFALTRQPAI